MNSEKLAVAKVIPVGLRNAFAFEYFNDMQSILVPKIIQEDDSMVIASPTGSGKTVLHEASILRLLMTKVVKDIKCVFIAPNKALCQQKAVEWNEKFKQLGLMVLEVTGDVDMQQGLRLIAKASIIVTTPEKWDSLTRSWRRHIMLFGAIDLLLVDEIHHLSEERGATLEAVIVRMRILNEAYIHQIQKDAKILIAQNAMSVKVAKRVRIIALSATLPNLVDIGLWLGCSQDGIHYFDEEFRPVPLTTHTIAFPPLTNTFLFEKYLDEKVADVISKYSEGLPTLIFCSSKRSTETLAVKLSCSHQIRRVLPHKTAETIRLIEGISESGLKVLASKGLAYHHAGLPPNDRANVEKLYLLGDIQILCSTSTLAHGVNLPAHLVIIKGTNGWRGGSKGYQKMTKSEIIQMIGRAGRPGFDTHGVAVIMTSIPDKSLYEGVTMNADIVESTLLPKLTEAICAEISESVIDSLTTAIGWLKATFFYVRVRRNPSAYGFEENQIEEESERHLEGLCVKALEELSVAGIIKYHKELHTILPNPPAHIMTRHVITCKTMVTLMSIPPLGKIETVLIELAKCEEIHKPVRRAEKKFLNDSMRKIRFPIKGLVKDSILKAYVLLQIAILKEPIHDFYLRVEQSEIVDISLRILSSLQELCLQRLNGKLLESCLMLDRALRKRVWESGDRSVLTQCPQIPDAAKKRLVDAKLIDFSDIINCSTYNLQTKLKIHPDEAKGLKMFAQICYANMLVVSSISYANRELTVYIEAPNFNPMYGNVENGPQYHLICYVDSTGELLCHRKGILCLSPKQKVSVTAAVASLTSSKIRSEEIHCELICTFAGMDSVLSSANSLPLRAEMKQENPKPRVKRNFTKTRETMMTEYYSTDSNFSNTNVGSSREFVNGLTLKNDEALVVLNGHDCSNQANCNPSKSAGFDLTSYNALAPSFLHELQSVVAESKNPASNSNSAQTYSSKNVNSRDEAGVNTVMINVSNESLSKYMPSKRELRTTSTQLVRRHKLKTNFVEDSGVNSCNNRIELKNQAVGGATMTSELMIARRKASELPITVSAVKRLRSNIASSSLAIESNQCSQLSVLPANDSEHVAAHGGKFEPTSDDAPINTVTLLDFNSNLNSFEKFNYEDDSVNRNYSLNPINAREGHQGNNLSERLMNLKSSSSDDIRCDRNRLAEEIASHSQIKSELFSQSACIDGTQQRSFFDDSITVFNRKAVYQNKAEVVNQCCDEVVEPVRICASSIPIIDLPTRCQEWKCFNHDHHKHNTSLTYSNAAMSAGIGREEYWKYNQNHDSNKILLPENTTSQAFEHNYPVQYGYERKVSSQNRYYFIRNTMLPGAQLEQQTNNKEPQQKFGNSGIANSPKNAKGDFIPFKKQSQTKSSMPNSAEPCINLKAMDQNGIAFEKLISFEEANFF